MDQTMSLREIMSVFLKGKWIISISIVMCLVISVILSWFVLEEKYQSKAIIQISSGVQDAGILSNYVEVEFTPLVYVERLQNNERNKLLFESLNLEEYNSKNLTIVSESNSNLIEVTYRSSSAENAKKHLEVLLNEVKVEMNESVKLTLGQLEETYLNESESLSTEIEQLMTRYNNLIVSNKLPEMLILQTIASSQFVLDLTNQQTEALATITGDLQNELLQLKAQMDTKSSEYRAVLQKYQSVKTGLDSFTPDPYIRIIVEPTLAEFSIFPNKLLNLAFSIIIGAVLGILYIFLKEYWRKSSIANK